MLGRRITEARERREAEKERHLKALCQPVRSLHRGTYTGTTAAAVPKSQPYRDPVLLEMQRARACKLLAVSNCLELRGDRSTTVACHENQGKGMGIKAGDERTVGGCWQCHCWYDTGTSPRLEKRRAFMAAHLRQVLEWRLIAQDPTEPERFRAAARRALERLNATPVTEEP